MNTQTVPLRSAVSELAAILDSPEIEELIGRIAQLQWTGRKGYPTRALVGMALAKSIYAIPTWTRVAALVREHVELRVVLGCVGESPSHWSCYRFMRKLREHSEMLDECIASVIRALRERNPDIGKDIGIDASDMPGYAKGQPRVRPGGREKRPDEFSDPDASWGHRSAVSNRNSGSFYGFKLHMAADSATELPLAWRVEPANVYEGSAVAPLLAKLHGLGIDPETCAMDKAYLGQPIHETCETRGCVPIIPLKNLGPIKRGEHKPPRCEHGEWRFAGADYKRKASKWRCPTGECSPGSVWVKASWLHPLIPRETLRWQALYRHRTAVERAFGRLKHEWGLTPLRVRRIERVQLHANLTILTQLACALSRTERVAVAA